MTNDQKLTIEQAYAQGVAHFNKGQFKPAVTLFSKIVRAAPKHAASHHMLGLIAFQTGQYEPALKALEMATSLEPQNPGFAANFTEVLRKAGKLDEAIKMGKQAVKLNPGSPAAHSNLGLVYYDTKNLEEAEASQKRAIALNPEFGPALNNLASIERDKGNQEQAIRLYRETIAANSAYNEAANNLIAALIEAERLEEAEAIVKTRLPLQPQDADLQCNIGKIALAKSELDMAETAYRNVISWDENNPEGYVGLGQTLFEKNHTQLALLEIEKALRLDPQHAVAYHHLGMIKAKMGEIEAGFDNYRKALALNPNLTGSQIAMGHLLVEQGDFEQARGVFEKVAIDSKDPISAHIALARLDKMTAEHPSFQALQEAAATIDTVSASKAVALHFAIGKAYEDVKDYDQAFGHFAKGAKIKRAITQYDPAENDEMTQSIIETFTGEFIDKLRASAISSDQPIFIVGMPRSGTTLTEAILNAHPNVFGAGELHDLQSLFGTLPGEPRRNLGKVIAQMNGAELTRKAHKYVELLDRHAPGTPHIVDKMPANFQLVGLINGLMPNAKIIHIARNPMDTCLSNFTRVFERSQLHSYDQIELGRFFNNYVRIMDHWKNVLPEGAVYTVHYEDLVDDIDTEARRMIDYCQLDWDDACLEFYKGKRRVRTASLQQVRQPLYATSKEKWRKYEAYLGPLIETIGDTKITDSRGNGR